MWNLFLAASSLSRLVQASLLSLWTWQQDFTCSSLNPLYLLHVLDPQGLRGPIRAQLQTTWSTRVKLKTDITLLFFMVSFNPDLFNNVFLTLMLTFPFLVICLRRFYNWYKVVQMIDTTSSLSSLLCRWFLSLWSNRRLWRTWTWCSKSCVFITQLLKY